MIYFNADIRSAHVRSDDSITSGSVGIPVALTLDSAFDGLAKTLCFKTSTASVDLALVGDATESTVPPDVILTAGDWLYVGIYAADGDGNIVIPTVWANVGKIEQGTIPSGVDPSEPTPSWVAQVQNIASEALQNSEDAVETADDAKEKAEKAEASASDAEAWAVGERDGEPVSADDPTYENNAKYWAERAMTDAPVTSVNGQAGDVELTLDDIPNGSTYARATPAQLAQIATNATDIADVKATADTALQPDDLRPYRTAAAQDAIDQSQNTMIGIAIQSKQAKITASGILKGDGAGGVSAAVAGTDYLQSAPVTSVNGQTGNVTIQPATDAQVATAVDDWLDENVAQETGYVLDASLTMSNAAPPASAVGDLKSALNVTDISVGLSFSGEYAPYYQFGWQLGDSSSGSIRPDMKYRVTSQIVTYESPITLLLDDGYQLYTVIYNDDGTVKNTLSFRSAIMVSAGQKVSITIKKTSEDPSAVLDVSEVLSHLHFAFASCGDYLLFYGNPNNPTVISNPVYTRMGSEPISGAIGRLRVRANGYRHFLQTFEADGTKLTDTNFLIGDYEYALDITRSYKIWFARIDNQNIDTDDISENVSIYMQRSGVPDVVYLNESQIPYIQQLFRGRPTLISADHELAFVHFSDVHRSKTNWNRVMQFAKQFSGNLSFVIHTGDFVAGDQRGYTNLYENGFDSSIPELNVVGNHDVYTDFANRTMAAKSVTKSLIFPDTSDWGVTWGTDAEPMNYYKDFAKEKIRLVVLDCYYDTESQATWLAAVLAEAKSLGYAVITATHEVTKSLTEFVDCTFSTKDMDALTTAGLNHSSTPYDAIIKTFKDSGGEHICNLCGHEHVDMIGYSENGILNIVIGASLGYDSTSSDIYRSENTRTFDLFNAVSVNQNQHLIKIVRIGANSDHYLQGRNVLCYDYQSKNVISNF